MDAYEVLNSSASASRVAGIACKEQHGGYMIPIHSKIGQEMSIHFGKLLDEHGKNELIPVCLENDTPNFYLNREMKSEETHGVSDAEQCFEKQSQQSGNEYGRAVRLQVQQQL